MTLETIYYITQIVAVGLILVSLVAFYIQQCKKPRARTSGNGHNIPSSGKSYRHLAQISSTPTRRQLPKINIRPISAFAVNDG